MQKNDQAEPQIHSSTHFLEGEQCILIRKMTFIRRTLAHKQCNPVCFAFWNSLVLLHLSSLYHNLPALFTLQTTHPFSSPSFAESENV